MSIRCVGGDEWTVLIAVPSSRGGEYDVEVNMRTGSVYCPCWDFVTRRAHLRPTILEGGCKHCRQLLAAAEEIQL